MTCQMINPNKFETLKNAKLETVGVFGLLNVLKPFSPTDDMSVLK